MTQTAVIFGGPTPEHDISILTGLLATRALVESGESVLPLYWTKTGDWAQVSPSLEGADFLQGVPKGATAAEFRPTVDGGFFAKKGFGKGARSLGVRRAVVCCHGGPGENGWLQGALDLAGIEYTGPSPHGAMVGADKMQFARVALSADLPLLPRELVTVTKKEIGFAGPYLLKPRFGGSSIGIEVVDSIETARALLSSSPHLRAGAVIEPYRPQSEDLCVAVRRFPKLQLSAIEKPIRSGDATAIYTYSEKYVGGEGMVAAPRELPAKLPTKVTEQIRSVTATVAEIMDIRGVARVDYLYEDGKVYLNEINTIPGSLSKHLWIDPEVPLATLLHDMLEEAHQVPTSVALTVGADGSALTSAGAIASKLA